MTMTKMAELKYSVSAVHREIDHQEEKVKDIERIPAIKKLKISNTKKRDLKEKMDNKDDQLNELRDDLKHNLEILFDQQSELNEIISSPQDFEKNVWRCNLKVMSLQEMPKSKDIRISHTDDGLANNVKLKDKTLSKFSGKLHQSEEAASHKLKISQNIMHHHLDTKFNCLDILLQEKNEQLSNQRVLAKRTLKKLQNKDSTLNEIATLNSKNRNHEAEMERYNLEKKHLEKHLECQQTEINDKDKLLTDALTERDQQKDFLQRVLKEKDQKEFELNQIISSLKHEMQSLEKNIADRDLKVLQLEEKIKSNEKEMIPIREKNKILVKVVKEKDQLLQTKHHLNHMLETQHETERRLVGTINILQKKNQCLERASENSELRVKDLNEEIESMKTERSQERAYLIRNLKEKDKQFSDRMCRQQQVLNQLYDTEKEIKKVVVSLTTRNCHIEKEIKDRDLKNEHLNEMLSESTNIKICKTNELSLKDHDLQLCELNDQLQNTLKQMQETEIVLNGIITSQKKQIHHLEKEADQRVKTFRNLEETLNSNAIKMNEMRDSNKRLGNTVKEKDEQLRKQNVQIKRFQERETQYGTIVTSLERKTKSLETDIERRNLKIKELEETLDRLRTEISDWSDAKVKDLKLKLHNMTSERNEGNELRLKEVDEKKKLQQVLKKLHENETKLNDIITSLKKQNQEKDDQISKVGDQLIQTLQKVDDKEAEIKRMDIVLKKMKCLEAEVERHEQNYKILEEMLQKKMNEMTKLSHRSELVETTLEENDKERYHFKYTLKGLQETDTSLDGATTSQKKTNYQGFEPDIKRCDLLVKKIEGKLDITKTEISGGYERLEKKLKEKERQLSEQRNQLQQVFNQVKEKETEFNESISVLQEQNKEKDNQIFDLRDQLQQTLKQFDHKKAEVSEIDASLKKKVKYLESEVEQREQNITRLKKMLDRNKVDMRQTVERNAFLERVVEGKDNQLHEKTDQLNRTSEKLQETDTEFGGIILSLKKNNQDLQTDIEERDLQIHELNKQLHQLKTDKCDSADLLTKEVNQFSEKYYQLQESLNQSRENEAKLNAVTSSLQTQNKEKDSQISKLTDKIEHLMKQLYDKEAKIEEFDTALKNKLKYFESEMTRCDGKNKYLEQMLSSKDVELTRVTDINKLLRNKVKEKDDQLHEQNDQLNRTSKKLQETDTELGGIILSLKETNQGLQTDINERDLQIHDLKEQLNKIKTTKTDRTELLTKEANQLSEKNYELQEALNQLREKEAKLNAVTSLLQKQNKEKDNQISELTDHKEHIMKQLKDKQAKIEEFDTSMKTKLKYFETELQSRECKIRHLQESLSSKDVELTRVTDINKLLRNKVKEKDDNLHEQNDQLNRTSKNLQEADTEFGRIILSFKENNQGLQTDINERDMQIHDLKEQLNKIKTTKNDRTELLTEEANQLSEKNYELQEALNQLRENEAKLNAVTSLLQKQNKEKDNQISELTDYKEHVMKQLKDKQAQIEEFDSSMKTKLKYFETEVESRECKIRHLQESLSSKDVELTRVTDINKLLRNKMKEKDDKLHEQNDQLNRTSKKLQETDTELGGIILSLKETNQGLQTDINERDLQIHDLKEQLNKIETTKTDRTELLTKEANQLSEKNYELQEALNQLREKEAKLNAVTSLLQKQNKEKDNQISELTDHKEHIMKQLKDKQAKIEEFDTSMKTKLKYFETELQSRECKIRHLQETLSSKDVELTRVTDINKLLEKKVKETDDQLRKQTDQLRQEIQHLQGEVKRRDMKVNDLDKMLHRKKIENRETEQNKDAREKEKKLADLKDQLQKTLAKLHDTETELDETKTRLSKAMGDRLTDNNPNITDLSDRNRPTKLAERCAELYDNQWTDAFDILEEYFNAEENVIEALLQILQDVMTFCITKAREQVEELGRNLKFSDQPGNGDVSADVHKLLKDCRRAVAPIAVGNLYKMYVSHLKQSSNKTLRTATEVGSYTSECLEICWFMVIQDPPVAFAPLLRKGSGFNTDLYKPYTSSGTHIDYVVWPPLLLHEGGPILAKGVAQGYGKKSEKGT
ncbi:putative leucine-rich repeat-containing protein DDB_G0290503 [Mercenaria mercenaria]|uniref:putative leucine-rich repeat-containing protein DDB_G0290503 n=1 Tax=Mercenaria mercenaria TaxID=6596 RepID=UPI00234EE1A0|nr:putative leucine-rich repeat-containing protein DDB_G0290503 [Mercenaria mercenaria]